MPNVTFNGQFYPSTSEYWLPGTSTILRSNWTQFQFELYAWTGTATSFPAAVAAGAQVADSGAFYANPGTDQYSDAGFAIDAIGDINPLNFGAFLLYAGGGLEALVARGREL